MTADPYDLAEAVLGSHPDATQADVFDLAQWIAQAIDDWVEQYERQDADA